MDDIELLTEEEKQEFLNNVAFRFCPNCGEAIIQPPRGRMKVFCSDECRWEWNHKHPHPENWKKTRTAVCPVCGREFLASREYKQKRKYCSHACANKGRSRKYKERIRQGGEVVDKS